MRGKIPLGRWAGVPVALDWSWVPIFLLVWLALGGGFYPSSFPQWNAVVTWGAALLATLIFFATILGHEFAHAAVARRCGVTVKRITLNFLGGVAEIDQDAARPRDEFLISIAGPLASVGFAALFWALDLLLGSAGARGLGDSGAWARAVGVSAGYLGTINLWLAGFNTIPAFPLDGGRMLRAVLWAITRSFLAGTRYAAAVGRVIGGIFVIYGLLRITRGDLADGWSLVLGWFLYSAAQQGYRQVRLRAALHGVPVGQVMRTDFAWVPAALPLRDAWHAYFAHRSHPGLPVITEGHFAGLITHRDLRKVPAAHWAVTPVSAAMTPVAALATVEAHDPADRLLGLLQARQIHQAPVLRDGRLVGLATRADLAGVLGAVDSR